MPCESEGTWGNSRVTESVTENKPPSADSCQRSVSRLSVKGGDYQLNGSSKEGVSARFTDNWH
jgi:hypothetical protein